VPDDWLSVVPSSFLMMKSSAKRPFASDGNEIVYGISPSGVVPSLKNSVISVPASTFSPFLGS